MTNELRKNIARNMRYAEANGKMNEEIEYLRNNGGSEERINALQKRCDENYQKMMTPMTESEYAEYDDNGDYKGRENKAEDILRTAADGVNHMAQGISLGWSDEMTGAIGGAGRVIANTARRVGKKSVNGESFTDAWRKGYNEYRDFARNELQNGYSRSPVVSRVAEVAGGAVSPVKLFRNNGEFGQFVGKNRYLNSGTTGFINGAGYTDDNDPAQYGENIAISTFTNLAGSELGNRVFGMRNSLHPVGRAAMNAGVQAAPYIFGSFNDDE